MKDIAPELLEKLKLSFEEKMFKNRKIKEFEKILKSGQSNYLVANDYAIEVGQILSLVFKENLSSDVLPDGRMYYNIAGRLLNDRLKENYNLISDFAKETQTQINKKMGLNIKGVKPQVNQDRIDGIIERISNEENYDEISWILDEPVKNFSQSIVDDAVNINVKTHYDLGLNPKIIRKESGSCCDWCRKIVGKYEYPDVPDEIYKRHRYCRCTVEYDPGTGKRQDVHTKKWRDVGKDDKIKKRKQVNIKVKDINRKDDRKQFLKYLDIIGTDNLPKTLSEFQNMKYDRPEEYERLKDKVFIQDNFNKGIWKDEVNVEKQKRHLQSTVGESKSYFFDDVDVEKLYNKYKMTGKIITNKNGRTNKELIDLYEGSLGIDVYSGKNANGFTIHYGKTGAHLVPLYYEE